MTKVRGVGVSGRCQDEHQDEHLARCESSLQEYLLLLLLFVFLK